MADPAHAIERLLRLGQRLQGNTVMSDKQLQESVLDALDFEPSINCAQIGVTVENAAVTLRGHVESYAQKHMVEKTVRRVKGVRAVADELEVRYIGAHQTADDEIAQRALHLIDWDVTIPDDIKVTVEDGNLTLRGEVEWQYQRMGAERSMRSLKGVKSVLNLIGILAKPRAPDIKRRIEAALRRSAEIEADAIRVTVSDGNRVTLDGRVHTWRDRQVAETAAWSVPGVQTVDDRLIL